MERLDMNLISQRRFIFSRLLFIPKNDECAKPMNELKSSIQPGETIRYLNLKCKSSISRNSENIYKLIETIHFLFEPQLQ